MTEDPSWLQELLDGGAAGLPSEGEMAQLGGRPWARKRGLLRDSLMLESSAEQQQTGDSFRFKWNQIDTFDSPASLERTRKWLVERYGDIPREDWWRALSQPVIVDAGCGAGLSALELFGDALEGTRYVGIDISEAVDVAYSRFQKRGLPGTFLQGGLDSIPLADGSVDIVFSEGVLHHTDDTAKSFSKLVKLLRPGGRILFYIYRKKGPLREFADDFVRGRLADLTPDEGWEAMRSLTLFGKALGELDMEIEIPEDIALLDIPAGRVNIQRLFYWHFLKAFYDPTLTLDELNHINFDWYAPANAHRHTEEEARRWCAAEGLEIERERVEPSGITVIARRPV